MSHLFGLDAAAASARRGEEYAVNNSAAVGGALRGSPAWDSYKRRFIDPSGRVVDTANANASHSEGQGYGLLLAVAASDRATFDLMLKWSDANLFVRYDDLAAWRWTPEDRKARDINNACDGDILIAWALGEGADLWRDRGYFNRARRIAKDIVRKCIAHLPGGRVILKPGAAGFSSNERIDGPIVNPSYWVFPAFARLAQVYPAFDWNGLAQSGLDLIDTLRRGPTGAPPDWLSLADGAPAPARGFSDRFGYDAIRVPLYLVWAGAGIAKRMAPFVDVFSPNNTRAIKFAEPGYGAIAALSACAASGRPYPADFYKFQDRQNYYPATLQLLAMIAAASDGRCTDLRAASETISSAWAREPARLPAPSREAEHRPVAPTAPAARPPVAVPTGVAAARERDTRRDEGDIELVPILRAAGLAAIAGAFAVWLWFRFWRRSERVAGSGDSDTESSISDAVSALRDDGRQAANPFAPRDPAASPFHPTTKLADLGHQIEIAAEASVRLSSTVGIVYFDIGAADPAHRRKAARDGKHVQAFVSALRQAVRKTDDVAIFDGRRVVVSICPLKCLEDLRSIADRLSSVARTFGADLKWTPDAPGYAIYPLNGYCGTELIAAAEADFHSKRQAASKAHGRRSRRKKSEQPPARTSCESTAA
ncbi:MAG: hypothetical protein KGM42_11580 [Hyphomicrobiales bacterium]|nr:hypothetical protein [Hyphomicrobiales bacterium]